MNTKSIAPRYTAWRSLQNGPSQKNRAEQDWVILMMALLFLVGIGIVIAICYVIILG
jgi:hypothetical protein